MSKTKKNLAAKIADDLASKATTQAILADATAEETIQPAADATADATNAIVPAGDAVTETVTETQPEAATNGTKPPRVFVLRMNEAQINQLDGLIALELDAATKYELDGHEQPQLALVKELAALIEKARVAPAERHISAVVKIWGYSSTALLHWMGAQGFSTFDAKNFLMDHGAPADFRKDVIASALAKGSKPAAERKVTIIDTLTPEQECELLDYLGLAAREDAAIATAKIDAAKARLVAIRHIN